MKFTDLSDDADLRMPGPDLTQYFANEIAKKMAAEKDGVIRGRLNEKLGADWNLEEVIPRLRWIQEKGHEEMILTLDGDPILELWPPTWAAHDHGWANTTETWMFNWRRL